ncbi:VOC family protein [Peribacillus kribbensis]|uniref:VOC family protein n=1 Tax=Peribacillus kribbensis TaxID=356658 RepID=UPI0003FC7BC3|nr:VOC family protein [Peribacillus kribbensis]
MKTQLRRVGTAYLPVSDVTFSAHWYVKKLGAQLSYQDEEKAIINMANQSFFLVKAAPNQRLNFIDYRGEELFSMTFEVNGVKELTSLHHELESLEVQIGQIEDRGHTGKNFVFYDPDGNKFDVWSELSRDFIEKHGELSS